MPSPRIRARFAQLAAIGLLTAPDPAVLDAAFAQLAGSRRVDVPLRQHIEELYATRCATCRSPVVAEQFIWPRDADAPGRKIYRCPACDLNRGGPEERSAPVDDGRSGQARHRAREPALSRTIDATDADDGPAEPRCHRR